MNHLSDETKIVFISEEHEKFFHEKFEQVRYADAYHMALVYSLGINGDTRRNIDRIYDFKTGCVKPECLQEGWQTSGSMKVCRMAFNLYCNGAPSIDLFETEEDKLREMSNYNVDELFCSSYAPFFWQAIQLRYPEYVV